MKCEENKSFFSCIHIHFCKIQKKEQKLWKTKYFFPKVILRISLLALPAFSDLHLAASQPSSLKGPASNVVISKWRNLKIDNSRQRCHLSTFRSLHKYWEISKGRVQITRQLGKTYLSYQTSLCRNLKMTKFSRCEAPKLLCALCCNNHKMTKFPRVLNRGKDTLWNTFLRKNVVRSLFADFYPSFTFLDVPYLFDPKKTCFYH